MIFIILVLKFAELPLKGDSKHIYTTATVVEHVQPHLVSMPAQQMSARQPAKKRKAARPGHYGERKGRVASGQEVLFSCDQCSVTFTDPQQAIKHISERHMMGQIPVGEGHIETMELHESQLLVILFFFRRKWDCFNNWDFSQKNEMFV